MLSHLVVQNGDTDAAVVETRLTAADVVFFDPSSGARIILEVSIVTIGSGTSLGEAHKPAWMGSTRSCERARRKSASAA